MKFWDMLGSNKKSFWDMLYSNENKFQPYSKISKFFEMTESVWYGCPGCIAHKVRNQKNLFNKFQRRSRKTYKLYWRTHPVEHAATLAEFKRD